MIEKIKKKNPSTISILLFLFILISIIGNLLIADKDNFWGTTVGAILGILGGLILYKFSLYFENRSKDEIKKENTIYVYQLYKDELEMNVRHINASIEKNWVPYFRLKTITRDKLWGELANYSKDLNLMKKLNVVYGEFELINNKIDIMNTARMAQKQRAKHEKLRELDEEILKQKDEANFLGKKILPHINECLQIINATI